MPEEIKPKHANVRLSTFVLLIILVAIAFGGAGLLYGLNAASSKTALSKTATATATKTSSATTSATSTADWKTYTNTQLGFSLKYPSNLYYKTLTNEIENRNTVNVVISDVQEMGIQDILDSEKIHIDIDKRKETLTDAQRGVQGGDTADDIKINGISAKKVVDVNSPSAPDAKTTTVITYLVPSGDHVFHITLTNNDESVQGNEKDGNFVIMEKVVNTFQLTK